MQHIIIHMLKSMLYNKPEIKHDEANVYALKNCKYVDME